MQLLEIALIALGLVAAYAAGYVHRGIVAKKEEARPLWDYL